MSLLEAVRERTARVTARARQVRIRDEGIAALAARLADERPPPPSWDPETHFAGEPAARLAYVLTLDAVNFGSGWFPKLRKRAGRSGYYTLALGLKERFEAEGPWSAAELQRLDAGALARVFGQDPGDAEIAELLELQARALRDLGLLLEASYGGRFEALVASAGGSAEGLVAALARMPLFRDVSRYADFEVPFLKRAQLAASDLALAFRGGGPGRFGDLDRLTMFADNLVPHVLRLEGALEFDEALAARIERGEPIPAGSPPEVEIRAVGVQAVERLVAALAARGIAWSAQQVDHLLWLRGQRPEMKARPRHRTRCPYY